MVRVVGKEGALEEGGDICLYITNIPYAIPVGFTLEYPSLFWVRVGVRVRVRGWVGSYVYILRTSHTRYQ